jgi:hypothetical protein
MDQFYRNVNVDFLSPMTQALQAGAGALGGLSNNLKSGYGQLMGANQKGYDQSRSQLDGIMDRAGEYTPLGRAQADAAASDFNSRRAEAAKRAQSSRNGAPTTRRLPMSAGGYVPY